MNPDVKRKNEQPKIYNCDIRRTAQAFRITGRIKCFNSLMKMRGICGKSGSFCLFFKHLFAHPDTFGLQEQLFRTASLFTIHEITGKK